MYLSLFSRKKEGERSCSYNADFSALYVSLVETDRVGCGEKWDVDMPDSARHLGGAGSDGGEEFPRVERAGTRRTPMGYPRSLPRENYPRFHCEIVFEGLLRRGEGSTDVKRKINFRKDVSSNVGERPYLS